MKLAFLSLFSEKMNLLTYFESKEIKLNNIYCTASGRAFKFYLSILCDYTLSCIPALK